MVWSVANEGKYVKMSEEGITVVIQQNFYSSDISSHWVRYVCVHAGMCVCVCVCVCERERERERRRGSEKVRNLFYFVANQIILRS